MDYIILNLRVGVLLLKSAPLKKLGAKLLHVKVVLNE